ncbi:MAG: hypothetical protein K6G34_00335 [Lachnospiraceae bacterium]|nr:hypothetical protein [Lachnospiraceae bacterium]
MVAYFRKMNIMLMILGGVAGAAIGFLLCGGIILGGDITRIFLFAMSIAAGIIISRTLASQIANRKLQSIYKILYKDLNPRRFIEEFAPLLETVPKNLAEYMTGCCHLSFAYEALGEFDDAYNVISGLKPEELRLHALSTTSLITNQKANLSILTWQEDRARALISDLEVLRSAASKRAATLAQNLGECIRLHNARLDAKNSSPDTDVAYLREEIEKSTNTIHRKEMQLELADYMSRQGAAEEARGLLEDITSSDFGLYTEKKAKDRLALMS